MNVRGMEYHVDIVGTGQPLVLLHGFSGSSASWTPQIEAFSAHYQVIVPDFPGHGHTDTPSDPTRFSMRETAEDLALIIAEITDQPVHLLGYSMGGRLALYFALNYPEMVASLILESASPGIADAIERMKRVVQDHNLALKIEECGMAWFAEFWGNLGLFKSQKRLLLEVRERQHAQRLENSIAGLAGSLRGMGTGSQPSLWKKLGNLEIPTLLMVGQLDDKFIRTNRSMKKLIPQAKFAVVAKSGHNIHLEQPDTFHTLVLQFLEERAECLPQPTSTAIPSPCPT